MHMPRWAFVLLPEYRRPNNAIVLPLHLQGRGYRVPRSHQRAGVELEARRVGVRALGESVGDLPFRATFQPVGQFLGQLGQGIEVGRGRIRGNQRRDRSAQRRGHSLARFAPRAGRRLVR